MAWQLYMYSVAMCGETQNGLHDLRGAINVGTQAHWPYLTHSKMREWLCQVLTFMFLTSRRALYSRSWEMSAPAKPRCHAFGLSRMLCITCTPNT